MLRNATIVRLVVLMTILAALALMLGSEPWGPA
jgi:hypothetical protein